MVADVTKDRSIAGIIIYSYDRFSRSGAKGMTLLEDLQPGIRIIWVTQKIDDNTPNGIFQEQVQLLFSKLDNDQRRDKSVSGIKSMLQKGFWPHGTPLGFTKLNKFATADKHVYVVNETGKLLKRAFEWKATMGFSNKQIIEKLSLKGLKISLKHLAWIFSNVFYCGYISSRYFPGELIKGKHPALVDMATFLKANAISRNNSRSGVPKRLNVEELPLKVFFGMRYPTARSPVTRIRRKSCFITSQGTTAPMSAYRPKI